MRFAIAMLNNWSSGIQGVGGPDLLVTEHALQAAVHMHGDIHHRVDAERRKVGGRELARARIAVGIIGDDGLALRERTKISRIERSLEARRRRCAGRAPAGRDRHSG